MEQSYFALLGLPESETDPRRIEEAYKQRKRLWDQRRHNPAYQHQWALRQEELARAFETLRRPEKRARHLRELRGARRRRPDALTEREFREVCELAMSAGYLTEETRRKLLERAARQGIPSRYARTWLDETLLRLGARHGLPAGLDNRELRAQTFRFFVGAALASGVLTEESREMLANLTREFGFSVERLEQQVDEVLLEQRPVPEENLWQRAGRAIGLLVRAAQQSREMDRLGDGSHA